MSYCSLIPATIVGLDEQLYQEITPRRICRPLRSERMLGCKDSIKILLDQTTDPLCLDEIVVNGAKYDGVRYGTRAEGPDGDGKPDGYLFSNTRGQGFGFLPEPLSSGI
jgi:hypothetical protein